MTALRILNLIVWGFMLVYMARGAWSAMFGDEMRRGDPMRLACFATAIVMCGFTLRWLVAPADQISFAVLYALAIADAVFIIALGRAYGRGPRV